VELISSEWWRDFCNRFGAEAEARARERCEAYKNGPAKAHWPPSPEDLDKIRDSLIASAKSEADRRVVEALPGLFEATDGMSLTDAATAYARAGIPVFPLKSGQKDPLPGSHGFRDATTDFDQIVKWWHEDPTRNIGISPDLIGCCVVECERDSAADVAKLAIEGKILPATCEVRSASGGRHLWFLGKATSTAKKLAGTIDTRGIGGYVLVPPSIIDDRDPKAAKDKTRCGRYSLSVQVPLAVLPAWVAERVSRPTERREASENVTAADLNSLPMALLALAHETITKDLEKHGKPVDGQGSDDRAYRLAARLGDLAADDQRLSAAAVATLMYRKWASDFDLAWLFTKARNATEYRQNDAGCDAPAEGFDKYLAANQSADQAADVMRKLSVSRWLTLDIPPTDWLLGGILSATSKTLGYSPTGLGKTNLYMAAAIHLAAGKDFLHWQTLRPSRWLYVDGEMPADLAKERIVDAVRRLGGDPGMLYYLNRNADFPDMPPLNQIVRDEKGHDTKPGVDYIESIIRQIETSEGKLDGIILDNIQCLLLGSMQEEEPWRAMLPWCDSLSRRRISQVWLHHTGHDIGHAYGAKMREWQMDTVIAMRPAEHPTADICFTLDFNDKHRLRKPSSRADYDPVTVILANDQWSIGEIEQDRKLAEVRETLDEIVAAVTELSRLGRTLTRRAFVLPADVDNILRFTPIRRHYSQNKLTIAVKREVHEAIEEAFCGKVSREMIAEALERLVEAGRLVYRNAVRRGRKAGYDLPDEAYPSVEERREPEITNDMLDRATMAVLEQANPADRPRLLQRRRELVVAAGGRAPQYHVADVPDEKRAALYEAICNLAAE
jgi:hypothetical protein